MNLILTLFLLLPLSAAAPAATPVVVEAATPVVVEAALQSTLVTKWSSCPEHGLPADHEVITWQRTGESLRDFYDRHEQAVAAAQVNAPPCDN